MVMLNKVALTLRQNWKVVLAFGLCGVLLIGGQLVRPGFSSYQNIMNLLGLSAFLGIIAAGQTFAVLSGGEGLDLSIGAIASFVAVVDAQLLGIYKINLGIVILVSLLLGWLLGAMNGLGVYFAKVPPLVMTLGTMGVIHGLTLVYCGGQPKGSAVPLLRVLGAGRVFDIPWSLIVWLALILFTLFILHKTVYGRALYATGNNQKAAYISGVRVGAVIVAAYAFSGMFGAFGGLMLLGYIGTVNFSLGESYMMPSIIAVVLGGISFSGGEGSYIGTIAGAIMLTILTSLLTTLNIGEAGRMIVNGVVLLTLLLAYARGKALRL